MSILHLKQGTKQNAGYETYPPIVYKKLYKNTKVFKQKIQNFTTKITVKLQTELVKFQHSNSNFKREFEF